QIPRGGVIERDEFHGIPQITAEAGVAEVRVILFETQQLIRRWSGRRKRLGERQPPAQPEHHNDYSTPPVCSSLPATCLLDRPYLPSIRHTRSFRHTTHSERKTVAAQFPEPRHCSPPLLRFCSHAGVKGTHG